MPANWILPAVSSGIIVYTILIHINPYELGIHGTFMDRLLQGLITSISYFALLLFSLFQFKQWFVNLPFLVVFLYTLGGDSILIMQKVLAASTRFVYFHNIPPVVDFVIGMIGLVLFFTGYAMGVVEVARRLKSALEDDDTEKPKEYAYYPVYELH